jgi:hypothetical protein
MNPASSSIATTRPRRPQEHCRTTIGGTKTPRLLGEGFRYAFGLVGAPKLATIRPLRARASCYRLRCRDQTCREVSISLARLSRIEYQSIRQDPRLQCYASPRHRHCSVSRSNEPEVPPHVSCSARRGDFAASPRSRHRPVQDADRQHIARVAKIEHEIDMRLIKRSNTPEASRHSACEANRVLPGDAELEEARALR